MKLKDVIIVSSIFHGQLQSRNNDEKLAAIRHDKKIHADIAIETFRVRHTRIQFIS